MAIDHEAPYKALAERIQTYCRDYISRPVQRRPLSFDELGQAEQSAIVVLATQQTPRLGGPESAIWTLSAAVMIYARADADPGSSAEPLLNKLIGLVITALERQVDETSMAPGQQVQQWTTLGGKVQWAHPGVIAIVDGAVGNEGIALVPVEMLPAPV